MAKFHFNLQTLLQHREDREQEARDELMRRSYRLQSEQHNLDELQRKFNETAAEEVAARDTDEFCDYRMYYRLYQDRLRLEIDACEKKLAQLRAQVEEQKTTVVEASKKRKTLSSLREKRQKEFDIGQEKAWQKEMDDLEVVRYKSGA